MRKPLTALSILFLWAFLWASPGRSEDHLALGYAEAAPGARGVAVPVLARHDLSMHGFSLSVAYPAAALRLLGITERGTATEEVGAEFFHQEVDTDSGTAVLGAIFAFSEPYQFVELLPTGPEDRPQILAWLVFDVETTAAVGEHVLRLKDGLGHPPVQNRFTHRGVTVRPQLENGAVAVQSENVLTLESKFAFPGALVSPLYAYARHSVPLSGFQVAVSFNPGALELKEATLSGTACLQLLGGASKVEFLTIRWREEDIIRSPTEARTTAGVIFDYETPFNDNQVLPPEVSSETIQSILRYSFLVKGGPEEFGEWIPLTLTQLEDPRALNNAFIFRQTSLQPTLSDGRIYFSSGFLTGTVRDFRTGRPLAGVSLTFQPGGQTASTVVDGSFRLGGQFGLAPGPYTVLARKTGYYPLRHRGSLIGKGVTESAGVLFLLPAIPADGGFQRGRVNADDLLDISDVIALLSFLFLGGEVPGCLDAGDANDDGVLDLSDAVRLLGFLFLSEATPPAPFAACGADPSEDNLGCLEGC